MASAHGHMARVVCIHGIGQEYEAEPTLLKAWAPALCGGVANAGGRLAERDVAMAFYGAAFRPLGAKGLSTEIPYYQPGDVEAGVETELLTAWAESLDGNDVDSEAGTKGLPGRRTAASMVQIVARAPFFGDYSQRVVIWFLKQVRRYLTMPDVRANAQQSLRQLLADDTTVVVAHSLGSVVAYDTLRHTADSRIRALVTLGSPLGTPALMRCLDPPALSPLAPWPAGVRCWFNIADTSDIVAVEKRLAIWFGERVSDALVDNGVRMHDVLRYLTAKETGIAVLRSLDA